MYGYFDGFAQLASGLSCGLAGLAAGMAIGIVGDAGVRATAQQPKLFVGMILILIFAEALALYGLIVGIILSQKHRRARARRGGRFSVWSLCLCLSPPFAAVWSDAAARLAACPSAGRRRRRPARATERVAARRGAAGVARAGARA